MPKYKVQHVVKPNTSSSDIEKVDEVLTSHTESTPDNIGRCIKVVEEDRLITDIIRSKKTTIIVPVRDILSFLKSRVRKW